MADKMTKRDWYNEIRAIIEGSDYEDIDGAVEFIDRQVELLDAKAAKATERAAAKRADGDTLRETIYQLVTETPQTADEILASLSDVEGITKAKVTARLGQLYKAGMIDKNQVKQDDGRRIMMYNLLPGEHPNVMPAD